MLLESGSEFFITGALGGENLTFVDKQYDPGNSAGDLFGMVICDPFKG